MVCSVVSDMPIVRIKERSPPVNNNVQIRKVFKEISIVDPNLFSA
jgi:hypothetical protein